MAVDTVRFAAVVEWAQSVANSGFDDSKNSGKSYSAPTITTSSAANRIYFTSQTIAAAGTLAIDCRSLTDALGQAIVATRIYGIWFHTSGAALRFEPGAANGLVFPFDNSSDKLTVKTEGHFMVVQNTATTVDATNRNLLFTNTSGVASTAVKLLLLLGQ